MFVEHLALTYKCHSSIGNSLDLNNMINEVLTTFVEETNAINGYFFLIDENDKLYKYLEYKKDDNFSENDYLDFINTFNIVQSEDDLSRIIILPLEKGIFFIVYKEEQNSINYEFIGSMFQDLKVKLDISIDACLNVQKMKNKNKMLKHLTEELKVQQKELIEADKYKSNFLANMSHELKTPLNSIIVLSSIMKKNKNNMFDEEQIKNINIINNCGKDLLFLINDILDISKIESGEISLNLVKSNIHLLIDSLIEEMMPLATEKKLKLEFNCLLDDITVLTDEHRIKQILKNLLSNAIKFTEEGIVDVVLEENANDITIKVIDEGIGIAEEKLKQIFDRFKQADGSTTRKYGGTGLGLSISRELAHLLGGDIKAFSSLGYGSTFELILPKKTNIKNISDDKVSISSNNDISNEDIEDIVLFDLEDVDLDLEKIKKQHKIALVNFDYATAFPVVVNLKKNNVLVNQTNFFSEAYDLLEKDVYDLVVINQNDLETEVSEFLFYCKEKGNKVLVVSDDEIEDEIHFNKQDIRDLGNNILMILGK